MKNTIQHILDQGFGLYSINEALSIQYHHDDMNLVITPLPGLNEEPIYMPIHSRRPGEIVKEILNNSVIILNMYRDQWYEDIMSL